MTPAGRLAARLRAHVSAQASHVPGDALALAQALNADLPRWDHVTPGDVQDACNPRRHGPPSRKVEVEAFALHVLACTRRDDKAACWECTRSEVRARHYLLGSTF